MITQKTYDFNNLSITQTIMETKTNIHKHIEVVKNMGTYHEILAPTDPDYQRAIILMINEKNKNE